MSISIFFSYKTPTWIQFDWFFAFRCLISHKFKYEMIVINNQMKPISSVLRHVNINKLKHWIQFAYRFHFNFMASLTRSIGRSKYSHALFFLSRESMMFDRKNWWFCFKFGLQTQFFVSNSIESEEEFRLDVFRMEDKALHLTNNQLNNNINTDMEFL